MQSHFPERRISLFQQWECCESCYIAGGMTLIRQFIGAIGIALLATSAIAGPEDDYITYQTTVQINRACGGLKYLEHERTLAAAATALNNTPQYRMSNDGRLPEGEYDTWFEALNAKVAAQVQAVGCTEQAMAFIMQGKGRASEEIYRGLVLSVHFASLPPTDIVNYVEIEPDRFAALQRYDGYLQALYRENFEQFAARQKEIAAQELPTVNPFGGDVFGTDDLSMGFGALLMSPEDTSKISNAKGIASYALDQVFFEVVAESAGFIVRPREVQATWTIPELRSATAPQTPGLTVIDGPGYDLIDLDPTDDDRSRSKLYSVLTLKPDNSLRVMYYGDAAAKVANGTVRLYVMNDPLPADARAYEFFESPDFRSASTGYDGVRAEAGCLSAACFDFPAAATDAFVAYEANQYAELFVSPLADAQPGDTESIISKQGRVSNFYAYKLLRQ